MALLDFSAAIDTLDHFASCFSDRFHSLIVDRVVSASGPLVYGVSQGPGLGQI